MSFLIPWPDIYTDAAWTFQIVPLSYHITPNPFVQPAVLAFINEGAIPELYSMRHAASNETVLLFIAWIGAGLQAIRVMQRKFLIGFNGISGGK